MHFYLFRTFFEFFELLRHFLKIKKAYLRGWSLKNVVLLVNSYNKMIMTTGDEAFKSISRVLGPRAKKPTLGVQHAVEAGYLKCMCLFVLAFY